VTDLSDRLASAAASAYAVPPEDFLATRKALVADAKAAGDREGAAAIAALRKPSVAAWAMNAAVRADAALGADLEDLGARMRDAQSRLDVAVLQGLRGDREALLGRFVDAAVAAGASGGRALSAAARDEVHATVVAALADAAASTAVTSGTLTRSLSYSGFGEVDLHDAVAVTSTGRVLAVVRGGAGGDPSALAPDGASTEGDGQGVSEARDSGEAAREAIREERVAALDAARRALDEAEGGVSAALEASRRARGRVEEAEHLLVEATRRLEARTAEHALADQAMRAATRRHADAATEVDRAAAALAELEE
jgi:hypothetical protein